MALLAHIVMSVRLITTSARNLINWSKPSFVKLHEEDLLEKFVKGECYFCCKKLSKLTPSGQGKGGQAVNKTSNKVFLLHKPTGLSVECHATRSLISNRSQARKLLQDKYDNIYNPGQSKILKRIEKLQKSKKNAMKKSRKKYAALSETNVEELE